MANRRNQELRREAHALGMKTYKAEGPCKHGHVSDRYTINGACMECTNGMRKLMPISSQLQPLQLLPVHVPTGLDSVTVDSINDYVHACMVSWCEQMNLLTPERQRAYAALLNTRVNARKLRALAAV